MFSEGEKQKRQALQKVKKTKIHEHEIEAEWSRKEKQNVTSLMNATLSKKKKF